MCISDDLINFWEKIISNKMADREHFEKMADQNAYGCDILFAISWIEIRIICNGSLGISNDPINLC